MIALSEADQVAWEGAGEETPPDLESMSDGVELVPDTQTKKSKPVIGRMAKKQANQMKAAVKLVRGSAAASTQTPEQVAAMAMEIAQKLPEQQKQEDQIADAQNVEGSNSKSKGAQIQPSRSRVQKKAALTGSEAPFPTLSKEFSDDITFNIMLSLKAQLITFKWKLMLLLLRAKQAVEAEKSLRWKRNPRWIMNLHGRHVAALWGHLGAARQLCHNPKTWWLADGKEKDQDEQVKGQPRRAK